MSAIARLDSPGSIRAARARMDAATIDAELDAVHEPAHGFMGHARPACRTWARSTPTPAWPGRATAEATQVDIAAGPLKAAAHGTVDHRRRYAADLDVTAGAPAMTPAPGLSVQSIALDAHVHGPFTRPDATGHVQCRRVQRLRRAGGAAGGRVLQGNAGRRRAARDGGTACASPARSPTCWPPHALDPDRPMPGWTTRRMPVTFALDPPGDRRQGHGQGSAATSGRPCRPDLARPDAAGRRRRGGAGRARAAGHRRRHRRRDHQAWTWTAPSSATGGQAPIPALLGDAREAGGFGRARRVGRHRQPGDAGRADADAGRRRARTRPAGWTRTTRSG